MKLKARILDLAKIADKGSVVRSSFFSAGEVFSAEQIIRKEGLCGRTFLYGGYKDAERKCLFLFPDYFCNIIEDMSDYDSVLLSAEEELTSSVVALRINGSGYRKLSHRDYLGAILNMGIERDAIGDICPIDDCSAVIFATPAVSQLLLTSCNTVGADRVKISSYTPDSSFTYEKKTKLITDTVASDRLDCVVSALINESRDRTRRIILEGLVECNYQKCDKTDFRIKDGDIISARGYGKFEIDNITDLTKKNRLRLIAKKYI